ncbi:DUF4124 domain-containing protein [Lysobacter fragariae]
MYAPQERLSRDFIPSRVGNYRSAMATAALMAILAIAALSPAAAQDSVVIYRCTDAAGNLTIQNNTPCPKGNKQQRKVMEAAPASPAPPFAATPAPAAPVASPAAVPAPPPPMAPRPTPPPPPPPAPEEPTIADADRLPPPVLFECHTYDNDSYLSEDGNPPQRCVTLTTTGIGGVVAGGSGMACEMKDDHCQRVPDGAACDSWRRRLREAESALQFGTSANRDQAQEEIQRLRRIVRDTTCGNTSR